LAKWIVLFYETEDGICEVESYLNERKLSNKAKALAWIQMLEDHGPQLPRPYADILRDGIHELRIKMSGDQGRDDFLRRYSKREALHEILKKSSPKRTSG
jgi:hypothetical protein